MTLQQINRTAETVVDDAVAYCELHTHTQAECDQATLSVLHEVQERCAQHIALLQKAVNPSLRFEAAADERCDNERLERAAA